MLKSGIKINEGGAQPQQKKPKTNEEQMEKNQKEAKGATNEKYTMDRTGKDVMEQVYARGCPSPPKMGIKEDGKTYKSLFTTEAMEKVHIPNTLEDSDSDSESLIEKIRQIEGCEEVGQSPKQSQESQSN